MKIYYNLYSLSRGLTFFLLLFLTFTIHSQVGIGNTDPDSSSILDISSTSKGILAPRMTTAQRLAITSPANSLLVYDTTLKSFYYFDTTAVSAPGRWIPINSASPQRDNYVLVKSVADFPAVSGGKITLDTNTYYEINGTIVLNAPINLNDAYVGGLDANEDILYRSTGPIFQGATGGSIRNVTLTGGGSAFNITGGTSLLIQNTIIANFPNVGTIKNVGLYFGNIVQFSNNSNGITYESIGNLLLSNQAWLGDNKGIYETFKGAFALIEKASGFSIVSSGATGLDVSSNPSVGNGILLGTVFSGIGTFVKSYSAANTYPGYNFSNYWTVNCAGIQMPKISILLPLQEELEIGKRFTAPPPPNLFIDLKKLQVLV